MNNAPQRRTSKAYRLGRLEFVMEQHAFQGMARVIVYWYAKDWVIRIAEFPMIRRRKD